MATKPKNARTTQDESKILEQQYKQLIKASPFLDTEDEGNLDQPYFGQIVQTVTTYSVCERPKLITG